MWKLETVLSVAVLFLFQGKGWAIKMKILNVESDLTRHIDQTIEAINNHSQELYQAIFNQRSHNVQSKLPAASQYEKDLEEHLQFIASFVDHVISPRKQLGSNKTQCRKFYNEYEQEAVEGALMNAHSDVLDDISNEFAKLLVVAKVSLKKLKEQAEYLVYDEDFNKNKSFNESESSKIENMRQSYYDNFISDMNEFRVHYLETLDGTAVQKKVDTTWEYFLSRAPEVIEKTYLCVIDNAL